MRSPGVWGDLCKCVALRALIRSVARAYALPFDSALLGEVLPYIGSTGMSSLKGYEKYGVDLGHFRLKLGMFFFFHSSLELGKFLRSYVFNDKSSN